MPNINKLRNQDLDWIIRESDALITVISKDGSIRVKEVPALIHRNVEDTPPYGYENTLSTKHHEVTVLQSFFEFPILNGTKVLFDGQTFTVHYVLNPEEVLITLYVR